MSTEWDIDQFKIKDIVMDTYDDIAVNALDFKVMLLPDVALQKRIERDLEYRPKLAHYSHEGIDYAIRRFEFSTAPSNGLVISREEYLSFIQNDSSAGPEFKIKSLVLDHTDPDQLNMAIQEQVSLRQQIADHIKTIILIIISANQPTSSTIEIVNQTQPFYDEFSLYKISFIELGSPSYKDAIGDIDLQTTQHSFLGYFVAPGTTLKDYIVSMT